MATPEEQAESAPPEKASPVAGGFVKKPRKKGDLRVRAVTTITLWVGVMSILLTGFIPGFFLVITGIGLVALAEFYAIARARGVEPLMRTGLICGFVLFGGTFLSDLYPEHGWLQHLDLFTKALAICLLTSVLIINSSTPVERLAEGGVYTVFGLVYVVWLFGYLLKIGLAFGTGREEIAAGFHHLLFLLAMTKCGDMGGYLIGRSLGRTPFMQNISPQKTMEGYAGVLAFSLGFAWLGYWWFGDRGSAPGAGVLIDGWLPGLNGWLQVTGLGLLIGVIGVIGDLVESALKRASGVSDSGGLVPGIGGFLDLIDSVLFTAPVFYFFLVFFVV